MHIIALLSVKPGSLSDNLKPFAMGILQKSKQKQVKGELSSRSLSFLCRRKHYSYVSDPGQWSYEWKHEHSKENMKGSD